MQEKPCRAQNADLHWHFLNEDSALTTPLFHILSFYSPYCLRHADAQKALCLGTYLQWRQIKGHLHPLPWYDC